MASNYESLLDVCHQSLMSQIRTYVGEEQLKALLEDPGKLDAMIRQLPQVSSFDCFPSSLVFRSSKR